VTGPRRPRAATRGSPLARWQTDHVSALLGVDIETVVVETVGDRRRDVSLASIGGQGAFTKEVQSAVLDGRADFAVHSAKDLPSTTVDGLVLAAVPVREDPRDALVGGALQLIPTGGRVGTGSIRRRAQLAHARPDLTFAELRGNVGTRLNKASGFAAIILAAAGLRRLGQADRIAESLDPVVFVPQAGQGALAVECRADDSELLELLAGIEDPLSRRAVDAERAFLAQLGGGCSLPAGAYALAGKGDRDGSDSLRLTGMIATGDGRIVLRHTVSGPEPVALGRSLAAYLLDEAGGRALLDQTAGGA
jgi:hydroxymethylbilane synthase